MRARLKQRQVVEKLKSEIHFSPVVTLQGPRHSGKTVLARDILSRIFDSYSYGALDLKENRIQARTNPSTFLSRFSESWLVSIDEAQKAPGLTLAT